MMIPANSQIRARTVQGRATSMPSTASAEQRQRDRPLEGPEHAPDRQAVGLEAWSDRREADGRAPGPAAAAGGSVPINRAIAGRVPIPPLAAM